MRAVDTLASCAEPQPGAGRPACKIRGPLLRSQGGARAGSPAEEKGSNHGGLLKQTDIEAAGQECPVRRGGGRQPRSREG